MSRSITIDLVQRAQDRQRLAEVVEYLIKNAPADSEIRQKLKEIKRQRKHCQLTPYQFDEAAEGTIWRWLRERDLKE